jgi:hypothetical protein
VLSRAGRSITVFRTTDLSDAPIYFLLVERSLSDALAFAAAAQPDLDVEGAPHEAAPLASTVRPAARQSGCVTLVSAPCAELLKVGT